MGNFTLYAVPKESKIPMLGYLPQAHGNVKGHQVSNCITGFHREDFDVPKLIMMGGYTVCNFSTGCSFISALAT